MTWAGVAVVVAGVGSAVYQGESARRAQSKSLRAQAAAERRTLLATVAEERRAEVAERRVNRRKPDVTSILFQERAAASAGPGSTILAGRGGSGRGGLLGSKSMLLG